MTTTTIGRAGELTLPTDVQERCGLGPQTAVRLIETRGGILLVPMTDAPMSAELAAELEEWQGLEAWDHFPNGTGNSKPLV